MSDNDNAPTDARNELFVKVLRWLFLINGVGLMTAMFAVFLPVELMSTIHNWLGLGEFPDSAITIYLARSTSLLYAVHGSLIFIVGLNIRKHWSLVQVFGWLHVVIGLTMFGIDLTTPMPTFWTASEGLPIAAFGLLIVWLVKRAEKG